MITKKSRYARTRPFSGEFAGLRPRDIHTVEGVIEHEVKVGDRLDHLARHYYNNQHLWYHIMDANPEFFYGQTFAERASLGVMLLREMEGSVILIPRLTKT
ncbi:hypothetical protein ACFQY0_01495 [Haloferula chungangensis]|uniref:LysM domain-containing protein n=1 Tax=Haloferula chungangensis TaxID=1048331 RepID=A0ABW2L3U0_9BACT